MFQMLVNDFILKQQGILQKLNKTHPISAVAQSQVVPVKNRPVFNDVRVKAFNLQKLYFIWKVFK